VDTRVGNKGVQTYAEPSSSVLEFTTKSIQISCSGRFGLKWVHYLSSFGQWHQIGLQSGPFTSDQRQHCQPPCTLRPLPTWQTYKASWTSLKSNRSKTHPSLAHSSTIKSAAPHVSYQTRTIRSPRAEFTSSFHFTPTRTIF
jgi:hypothetical protein